jgi:pyridinium-3,5-bisthiocarboxylic acid mononucleotide nickel chelatase
VEQKIVYLDCHSGVSGDMLLGALLDAGLPFDLLQDELKTMPLVGYELRVSSFQDQGITGSRFEVIVDQSEQHARHLSDIIALLSSSTLSPSVRDQAIAVFHVLGEAEAKIHNVPIEEIHFHEVGAVDSIIDIVGSLIAFEQLGITDIYASPLPFTRGHVRMAHGLIPVPAPATLEILSKVPAPWIPSPIEGELVTPTGAALLATLARFEMPAIAIERIGYGFGQKRLIWPNCLRACIGHSFDNMHTHVQKHEHHHQHTVV